MEGFPFVHRERIRFRDVDYYGHVNNAVYLTFLEQARIAFFIARGVQPSELQDGMILARAEIDFRAQLSLGEEVAIGVRTARVGTKSFELEYALHAGDRLVAEAKTVLVGFDYERNETVTIPDGWRRGLTE